jgi:hypothetical protein
MRAILIYQRMNVICLVKCKKITTDIYETLLEICVEEILSITWDLKGNK